MIPSVVPSVVPAVVPSCIPDDGVVVPKDVYVVTVVGNRASLAEGDGLVIETGGTFTMAWDGILVVFKVGASTYLVSDPGAIDDCAVTAYAAIDDALGELGSGECQVVRDGAVITITKAVGPLVSVTAVGAWAVVS